METYAGVLYRPYALLGVRVDNHHRQPARSRHVLRLPTARDARAPERSQSFFASIRSVHVRACAPYFISLATAALLEPQASNPKHLHSEAHTQNLDALDNDDLARQGGRIVQSPVC